MEFKKIMLITLILLAVLTIGAVSASDEADFNETLTVDDTQEVSLDASFENDTISAQEGEVLEDGITEDNFDVWVSSHQWEGADWGPQIVSVWGDDSVHEGTINLTIAKDAQTFSDVKAFDGADAVLWDLNELREGIVNEVGTYKISLKYQDDGTEIDLGQHDFTLTKFNFNVQEGDLYREYPFDIIRLYDDVKAEVYVNSKDEPYSITTRNPIGWTLSDLDISSVGKYNITVVTYDEDDVVADNFTFTLNIVDNHDWFRLYSQFNIKNRDLGKPVLYLFAPKGLVASSVRITSEEIGFENEIPITIDSQWMGWTLDELGIDENSGYNVQLLNNGESCCDVWLNVEGIIDENSFNKWMSSHESITNDGETWIVNVHAHDGLYEGDVIVSIANPDGVNKTFAKSFEDDADEHNDVIFKMDDLREILNEPGTYTFNVTYIKDDTKVDLITDSAFALTHFNYGAYEGEIYKDYPFDIIRIWDDDVDVEVYVGDRTTPVPSGGDNPLRWTLDDLGIDSPGDYTVTVNASKDGLRDFFTFNLKVFGEIEDFILYSNSLSVGEWEIDEPVLYLFSKEDDIGKTLRIVINDGDREWDYEFDVNGTIMSWNLESLKITENRGYDIRLFDGEAELASAYLDVNGFEEPINVDIWDDEEKGKLYNDYTGSVISVDVPEDKSYGEIVIIVNNNKEYKKEIDWENRYCEWTLEDLEMTSDGEYNIVVKHIVYGGDEIESDDIIAEAVLNVYTFNNDNFRVVLDKDSEILKVYCYETGTVFILVEREDGGNVETITDINRTIENTGEWMEFSLHDLGFNHDGCYYGFDVTILDSANQEVNHFNGGHSVDSVEADVGKGEFYLDYEGYVIRVFVPEGNIGELKIIVNGNVKYLTNAYPNREYVWNLKTLNITKTSEYTLTVKFNDEVIAENNISVTEFANDTFRVKCYYEEGVGYVIFCPEGAEGTITVKVYDREQDDELVETHEIPIDDKYKGKWTALDFETEYDLDENAFIEVEFDGNIINMEEIYYVEGGIGFEVNNVETGFSFNEGEVVFAYIPYDRTIGNASINITSGEYSFYIKLSEFDGYEWDNGDYKFALTKEDLNYFNELSDKDVITFVFVHDNGKLTRWMSIKKEDDDFSLYSLSSSTGEFGTICAYGLEIIMEANTFGEDEEDEEESDEVVKSDYFATVSIPDSFNVTDGKINIVSRDNIIFSKSLSQINHEYLYHVAGNRYYISFDDLNLENIKDKDIINITLTSNDDVIDKLTLIHRLVDGNSIFYEYFGNLEFDVRYGELANPEYDWGIADRSFIFVMIPDALDVPDGNIIIALDDGTVLFNWTLDLFDNTDSRFIKKYSNFNQGFEYVIMANETIYSAFPENANLTFKFVCGDKIISHKGIVKEGELHRIVVSDDVTRNMFEIIIPDNVLINGDNFAVTIRNIGANRQTINYALGGGYFSIYVNGKRIEDLGRLNRYDGETELVLTRLCSNSDGVNELTIYLGDLNITENGAYDIRVTHNVVADDGITVEQESEIFSRNVTLTSNVKAENATSKSFTGFGMNPILLYLDTYYGDITSDVTGNITVLNSTGDEILFISDISKLSSDNGRYYLKYSDFTNKNFGDKIIVMYEGNERSGNTTVNVTWKDVDTSDFNLTVDDDVNDYYANFVNLQIPDLIATGKIIVTVTYNNNPDTSISNMNVSTDYGSKAVYTFNVADIKSNANGELGLSLSDLGFYEDKGDYVVDVKFTVDESGYLDVTNNTLAVDLSPDINITIDDNSRYTKDMDFATVKIFDPSSASNAKLFIDGVEYASGIFEEGLITFASSPSWTPGNHTARIEAYNQGSVVATLTKEFEVLVKSDDTNVTYETPIKEGKHAIININVANDTQAIIELDNGERTIHILTKGENTIDLGVLTHGNHTIGIFYETMLADGSVSFYNGYITISVEYESWLDMPDPIVLDDDDTIRFNLDDATGNVTVTIDGQLYDTVMLENGTGKVRLANIGFGKHNYTITYNGDDTHERVSQSGQLEVKYIFKDDIITEGYPLKDSYVVTVILPEDATGNVTLIVDDAQYVPGNDLLGAEPDSRTDNIYISEIKDGKAVFELKGLSFGAHRLSISYDGDAQYPKDSYETLFDINHYAVIGDITDTQKTVSLLLPANATGNLVVYNENRREILYVQAISEGRASVDLNNLTVGIYEIRAYYDGEDYEVKQFTHPPFKVMPKVVIAQDEIIGEDVVIFVDLDNATGHLLIIIDGISPILEELDNGTVNYTFKTQDYSCGNHSVTFMYIGNSFDPDVLNTVDETGRYVPVKYYMNLLPIKSVAKVEAKEGYVSYQLYDEDGNPLTNATGTVEIYRDGVLEAVVEVNNGIVNIPMDKFKSGSGTFTFVYSGDKKHSSSTTTANLNIVHKAAKITAKDLTVLYSSNSKYSVTVYSPNGNLAANTAVSFMINNKAYKTVKTNAKGIATVVISSNPGSYKITSKALGVSVTKNLKVNHVLTLKKAKVKRSAKKLVIKATLKKVNGKYLKGKKITLKFNGKKFKAKTNKKGVAKFTIKSKVLKKLKAGKKVKIQATYLKDTVKQIVKVKK